MADFCLTDWTSIFSGDIDKIYSDDICKAALRGEKLPANDPSLMAHVTGLCVLRGIRHHDGFAVELLPGSAEQDPVFARALHARAIMSNKIPDISAAEEFPYCIWYPDVASEGTYRQLARRYPHMRYQVGRACAVAGYNDLYSELDLLPDVAIAEEAQDSVMRSRRHGGGEGRCSNASQDIFDQIVRHPVRWQVMNDCLRSVDLDCPKAASCGLNGDTAVVSTLELKRGFRSLRPLSRFDSDKTQLDPNYYIVDEELAPCYFNITEDWNVDEHTSTFYNTKGSDWLTTEEMAALLWNPLPRDLPSGNKDLLILMAAYHGNVDRYARLRRPAHFLTAEAYCVVRGIYNNTMFAKWCSLQPDVGGRYASAITARFIMTNDLSRITDDTPDADLPRQIWFPLRARAETYVELARRRPAATAAVARALIVADYQEAWDGLAGTIEPYRELMVEAEASANPHYLASLKRMCAGRGLDPDALEEKYPEDLGVPVGRLVERTTSRLVGSPRIYSVPWDGGGPAIYDGVGVDVAEVELFAVSPRELRPSENPDSVDLGELYQWGDHEQPPGSDFFGASRGRGRGSRRGGRGRGRGSA
ncbi:hypothetical protein INS49_013280 [Diaporthe citri]|uniref:uncharacterized protein n=1 Tax=Diaporthe citri TaxID=83186 RepID=UPI001C7E32F7|nr:uncharacterized protein INS49_013280 [Diaporthe citri]KAG6357403.1 hypothetical protein INS49_013280 [Diaporthe citri]